MFIDRTLDATVATNASLVSPAPVTAISGSTWAVSQKPRLFEAVVTAVALGLSFMMVAGAMAEAIR